MNYLSNITETTNASASNFIFSSDNPVNNEYSSFLESLSEVCHEVASSVLQSKIFQMGFGALASLKTGSLLPLALASLKNVPVAKSTMIFQNHIVIPPGKSWFGEANFKIALCKKGPTCWDRRATCNYKGPPMHVTVIHHQGYGRHPRVFIDGPYSGSDQWHVYDGHMSLEVKNDSDEESLMYVHLQNH